MSNISVTAVDNDIRRLRSLFTAIAADWAKARELGKPHGSDAYLAGFDSEDKIRERRTMYTECLAHIDHLDESVGCDLGCWLGLSAAILKSIGPRLVHGIEVREEATALADEWQNAFSVEGLRFRMMRDGAIPLLSGSIDWVLINQVLCNAVRDSFETSLRETFRILRPGGWLVFCDSNNPHCPDTWVRLERSYRRNELGPHGTEEKPDGPYWRKRRSLIREIAPDLSDDDADRLACETCYLIHDEIVAAVSVFRETGRTPMSVFEAGSRRTPWHPNGASCGTVTDPFVIASDLERIGFDAPVITTSTTCAAVHEKTLLKQLRQSQGFYVFAQKPAR